MKYFLAMTIIFFAAHSYAEEPTYQECFKMVQGQLEDEQQRIDDEAKAVQRRQVPVEIETEQERNPFDPGDATLVFNPNAADGEKRYDLEFKNINTQDYMPEKLDAESMEGQCKALYGPN